MTETLKTARQYIPKLRAMHDRYAKAIADDRVRFIDPARFLELSTLFESVRLELISLAEFADLPLRLPKIEQATDFEGRGLVQRANYELLVEDVAYALQILEHPIAGESPIRLNREGLFVAGQAFDAMRSLADILRTASSTISIVDGYVGADTLNLCSEKKPGVKVEILTFEGKGTPLLQTLAIAFNQQHGDLTIRSSRDFHDRFIVIDGADHFHVGSSIKDAGKRGFMFSLIEEPEIVKAFDAGWAKAWAAAKVLV